MKDANHHLLHIQKKVVQEARKHQPIENVIIGSALVLEKEIEGSPAKKKPRHIPSPKRIKTLNFH